MPLHDPIPGCIGNVSHRGYLMPVLDPCSLGTDRSGPVTERFVILRVGDVVFGLLLDSFVRIGSVEDGIGKAVPDGKPYASRLIAYGDGALVLLSVDAVVDLVKRHFVRQQFASPRNEPAQTTRNVPDGAAGIYLSATIESLRFAVPVEHVTEIVEGSDVTPLFNVPPLLRGLMSLRGQVLACIDISGEFGFPLRSLEERNQFVILRRDDAELALCVDKVTGIRHFAQNDFQRSEAVLGGEPGRLTSGVHEGEDGTLLILAVPAVFEVPVLAPYRGMEA